MTVNSNNDLIHRANESPADGEVVVRVGFRFKSRPCRLWKKNILYNSVSNVTAAAVFISFCTFTFRHVCLKSWRFFQVGQEVARHRTTLVVQWGRPRGRAAAKGGPDLVVVSCHFVSCHPQCHYSWNTTHTETHTFLAVGSWAWIP